MMEGSRRRLSIGHKAMQTAFSRVLVGEGGGTPDEGSSSNIIRIESRRAGIVNCRYPSIFHRHMTTNILDEIVETKRREVATARRRMPIEELEAQAAEAPPVRDFRAALAGPGPIRLIAEVKKASPSAKVIRADFDPVGIARTYQAHGAACLSVLTDAPFFQGHLSYLARIRASVAIPLLRKDFVIDEYQAVEARLAGADAVLLIAEILDDRQLAALLARIKGLGMAALVEFHDEVNLPRVLAAGADLVGINNRDLSRFVTDLDLTFRLRDRIPSDVILVSESGIRTRRDVERLEAAGVSAILVGETLMRADDIGQAVEQLLGLTTEPELK
jgi:indole-3-glycerol phosphate synthase